MFEDVHAGATRQSERVPRARRLWLWLALVATALTLGLAFFRHDAPRASMRLRSARGALAVQADASIAPPPEDARVRLGRSIFFDADLSEPRGTSCASCHDPNQGYAGNHGSELGTATGSRPGRHARRNTQSVMYLRFVRRLHMEWEDEAEQPEAFGGFFWDGRADTIAAAVRQPLLNSNEMANHDEHQVAGKLARSAYADELRREFDSVFDSDERAMAALGYCLEAFLTSRSMSPFSSRYDDYVRGQAQLSALEQRGLAAFQDPERGACSACHRLDPQSGLPESSLFTDYGYDVVAVPRNRRLPARGASEGADLGLCERRDPRRHTDDPWFCGAFRTPSLRNVSKRSSFMHNGVFSSLREVLQFYATRSTEPERWYGKHSFDDLPARFHDNVNGDLPPYNQPKGERARLQEADIEAILAFLETLADRDVPGAPR